MSYTDWCSPDISPSAANDEIANVFDDMIQSKLGDVPPRERRKTKTLDERLDDVEESISRLSPGHNEGSFFTFLFPYLLCLVVAVIFGTLYTHPYCLGEGVLHIITPNLESLQLWSKDCNYCGLVAPGLFFLLTVLDFILWASNFVKNAIIKLIVVYSCN